jgi:enolase
MNRQEIVKVYGRQIIDSRGNPMATRASSAAKASAKPLRTSMEKFKKPSLA